MTESVIMNPVAESTSDIKDDSTTQWYDFIQVVITELDNETKMDSSDSSSQPTVASNEQPAPTEATNEAERFYVEEPLDYIFEPDHYPKQQPHDVEQNQQQQQQPAESKCTGKTNGNGINNGGDSSVEGSQLNEIQNENKFTHATVVGESDEGFLEYEYKSYTYKRALYTNRQLTDTGFPHLDHDYHLLNDYTNDSHLSACVRGVSLSSWPQVGFGFTVKQQQFGAEIIFFVCDITPESPAEMCLRMGDILVEVDEINTASGGDATTAGFHSADEIQTYLAGRTNVHLIVIPESKYHHLAAQSNPRDFLRNVNINCEDIVIVSHSR
jgi:hypothetical protein